MKEKSDPDAAGSLKNLVSMKDKEDNVEQTSNAFGGQSEMHNEIKRNTTIAPNKKEMRVSQHGSIVGKLKRKQVDMSFSVYYCLNIVVPVVKPK